MTDTNTIPAKFTAGDSGSFSASFDNYSPVDGWGLAFKITNGTLSADFAGAANGTGFDIPIDAATSGTLGTSPGVYGWTLLLTKGAERVTATTGQIEILPDPENLPANYTPLGTAQIALQNIDAVLQKKATQDQLSYSIDGRTLSRFSFQELLDARARFARLAENEANKANGKASGPFGKHVKTRFVR